MAASQSANMANFYQTLPYKGSGKGGENLNGGWSMSQLLVQKKAQNASVLMTSTAHIGGGEDFPATGGGQRFVGVSS